MFPSHPSSSKTTVSVINLKDLPPPVKPPQQQPNPHPQNPYPQNSYPQNPYPSEMPIAQPRPPYDLSGMKLTTTQKPKANLPVQTSNPTRSSQPSTITDPNTGITYVLQNGQYFPLSQPVDNSHSVINDLMSKIRLLEENEMKFDPIHLTSDEKTLNGRLWKKGGKFLFFEGKVSMKKPGSFGPVALPEFVSNEIYCEQGFLQLVSLKGELSLNVQLFEGKQLSEIVDLSFFVSL